jgi:ribosome maturation factor RimP
LKLEEKIANAIEAPLNGNGYELVDVKIAHVQRTIIKIDIECLDDAAISLDDCVKANNLISVILDVEDFIAGPYNLEVSSPGVYRSLRKANDFERFCGKYVKIELVAKMRMVDANSSVNFLE